jgi:exosome complex component RRP45
LANITPSGLSKMPRDATLSKNEQQFLAKALEEGLRLDGRKLDEYRQVKIAFGDEYGAVEVAFGKTM